MTTLDTWEYPTTPTSCDSCRFATGRRGEGAIASAECGHPLVTAEVERRRALPLPLRDILPPLVTSVILHTVGQPRPCHAAEPSIHGRDTDAVVSPV